MVLYSLDLIVSTSGPSLFTSSVAVVVMVGMFISVAKMFDSLNSILSSSGLSPFTGPFAVGGL